jgi:hypothetical protein
LLSTATHIDGDVTHAVPRTATSLDSDETLYELAPEPGLVEVKNSLSASATHRDVDGQAIGDNVAGAAADLLTVHAAVPPVGFDDTAISPLGLPLAPSPTNTHRELDGHASERTSAIPAGSAATDHAPDPPVGSVEVKIWLPPTATHNEVLWHVNTPA